MDFLQIRQLYPTAQLKDEPFTNEGVKTYPYKNKWIHLPLDNITRNEQILLDLLLNGQESRQTIQNRSKWFSYFNGEKKVPPATTSPIRMIQIKLQKKDFDFDKSLWLESLRNLLEPVLDVFFVSSDFCLIIQNKDAAFLAIDEIQGMLQTLEDDFSLRTICYIGQYWKADAGLLELLQEEQLIFQSEVSRLNDRLATLADVALRHFTSEALQKSALMQRLKETLEEQEDWKELIQSLWESQGNISVASKSLYVHRNTLQYRMEKFYEISGLSLKNMNELALCYLLIL